MSLLSPEGPTPPGPPSISDWHAFEALWNAGEFLLTPVPVRVSCPLFFGSGKFGTPCERMQRANFSASAWRLCEPGRLLELSPTDAPEDAEELPPAPVDE
jgi:hypothetical protein